MSINKELVADLRKAEARIKELERVLQKIASWELPDTGLTWDESGRPMSYESAYGSNGAKDYIRAIANAAIYGGKL